MKKILFGIIIFHLSSDLIGQTYEYAPQDNYEYNLRERYDSIPTKRWNCKFISAINEKFDSLIKQGVDSIMVYYYASHSPNFALLIFKKATKNCTIAFYEYISNLTHVGSEILDHSVLDSTNILAFYTLFKYNQTKSVPETSMTTHPSPTFGEFYFGKSRDVYGVYQIGTIGEFWKKQISEEARIINREKQVYDNKNK